MSAAKEIVDRQAELESERAQEEFAWREIARLFRPDDQDFNGIGTGNTRDSSDAEIFDATPLYALDDFVGGMFGQGMNPTDRWFGFGVPGDPDLAKWGPVREWRWQAANAVYGSLSPAVSPFYSRAPAWLANMGAFGFGPAYQEEWVGKQQIIDMAIPVGETYMATDATGRVNEFNRKFTLTGRQIAGFFGPQYVGNCGPSDKKIIIHAVKENPGHVPGRIGQNSLPWLSAHASPDLKDFYIEKGYYEFPYHIAGWNERMRSAYPSGPGHVARGDAAMLQEMERSALVAGQFDAEPPLLIRDESALTAADIVPGAILAGAMNDQGKPTAQWLQRNGHYSLSEKKSEERRAAIRMAFRFSMMQVVNRPQMTLGEFTGWKEQELRLMAPNLTRLQTHGLAPYVTRRFNILARAGQIPPMPRELVARGGLLSVVFESPLARVQRMADARSVLQAQQAVEQLAVTDPAARDNFDADVAAVHVIGAFTDIPGILRDPAVRDEQRAAKAALLQQQRKIEQQAQQVETAAVASHAMQAQTSANNRGAA